MPSLEPKPSLTDFFDVKDVFDTADLLREWKYRPCGLPMLKLVWVEVWLALIASSLAGGKGWINGWIPVGDS